MNRAVLATALLLGLAGCGGGGSMAGVSPSAAAPKPFVWNDGNPSVPVCGLTLTNCKRGYTVRDLITGAVVTLPTTATSYTPLSASDTFEIRADGYDWQGLPISSAYEPAP
jgi:hypothetical protein